MFVFNNGRHLKIILMGNEYTNNFLTISGKGEKNLCTSMPVSIHCKEVIFI